MESGNFSPSGARGSRLGRLIARIRQRRAARDEAEQSLASILEAGGQQVLPPTPTDRIVKAGSAALKEQVAKSPQARRLAEAARRHIEADEAPGPSPVQRALHGPRQMFQMLVEGEAPPDPRALPGQKARPALPGQEIHAGHAASVVATRYGAHALVLAVVLLVVLMGSAPALHARVIEEHQVTGAHDDLTNAEGELLPTARQAPGAGDFLTNGAMPLTQQPDRVQTYTAVQGDTPYSVATRFNLQAATVLAANGLTDPDLALTPGQTLIILPFDGTYHTVQAGDTLDSIAQRYQVAPDDIIGFKPNGLEPPYQLTPGQALVVPGGSPPPREAIVTYHTHPGDTLDSIAAEFDVDVQTILDANDGLDPAAPLTPGQALQILPVPGLAVTVQPGDTVDSLANTYSTDPSAITGFAPNHLQGDATLQPGVLLIVPGGQLPDASLADMTDEQATDATDAPAQVVASGPAASSARSSAAKPSSRGAARPPSASSAAPAKKPVAPAPAKKPAAPAKVSGASAYGTGRFMWPVNGRITQYFWAHHNGLDIAIAKGTPIHAADSGEVVQAGWRTDGLGYAVQIDHHNGYVTLYGHMVRQPSVRAGQLVAKGQVIGYIGSTGHSTGPHVHFIIRTPAHHYYNPLRFLP